MSLNKNIIVILFISGLVMSFAVISFLPSLEASAKSSATKPYNATTIDECIQEKECVWYAFEKLLLGNRELVDHTGWVLRRWEKPVSIQLLDGEHYEEKVESIVDILAPYFPHKININGKGINSFFVFSNSLEDAFLNKYYELFQRIYVTKMPLIEGGFKRNINVHCYENQLHNSKKEIVSGILMADTDHDLFEKCLRTNLYGILADTSTLNLPFDFGKAPSNINQEYTDVDLLLLKIMYSPTLRAGMTFEEVQQHFDDAYQKAIEQYLSIRERN